MGILDFFRKKPSQDIDSIYDCIANIDSSTFFQKVAEYIMKEDIDIAYRMICRRNSEMPISPGIYVDWNKRYHEGIKVGEQEIYENQLLECDHREFAIMAIYHSMGGLLHETQQYKKCSTDDKLKIRQIEKNISAERHRSEYKEFSIEKYRFIACLDDITCPICGKLDGQVFNMDEMLPGINYPPMHDGCRCTTIAAWDDLPIKGTRFARDPVTHRGIQVPADMTYMDYKKEYLDK